MELLLEAYLADLEEIEQAIKNMKVECVLTSFTAMCVLITDCVRVRY